jgi:hypothetical protein
VSTTRLSSAINIFSPHSLNNNNNNNNNNISVKINKEDFKINNFKINKKESKLKLIS